jgi:exonuclease VII small subunit
MESQTGESMVALSESMERMEARLEAAASLFERAATLLEERESSMSGEVRKIVAAVETNHTTSREAELEKKLETAEQQIAELRAQVESQIESKFEAQPKSARKTVPASTAQFLAKQGIASLDSLEASTLDAALNRLSLEQRIAVKAQLLRAGVVS